MSTQSWTISIVIGLIEYILRQWKVVHFLNQLGEQVCESITDERHMNGVDVVLIDQMLCLPAPVGYQN